MIGGSESERAANVFGGDGLDGVVDGDLSDVGGAEGGGKKEHGEASCVANPELMWPPAAAELRSAWTGEGARPHTGLHTGGGENVVADN